MIDKDVNKLITRLLDTVATKEDLKDLATKEDLNNVIYDLNGVKNELSGMDIKDDLRRLSTEIKSVERNLSNEIKSVGNTFGEHAHEIDNRVEVHEKRLKKLEVQTGTI